MNSTSWSRDETLSFISAYKKHPCLYDPHHKEYHNKVVRCKEINSLLQEVQEIKPNVTLAALRRKIKTLLGQISREKTRQREFEANNLLHRSKLWCYDDLRFLFHVTDCRNKDINENISSDNLGSKTNLQDDEDEPVVETPSQLPTKKICLSSSSASGLSKTLKEAIFLSKDLKRKRQQKSKEDAFGEFLALELKSLHSEQHYDDAVIAVFKCIQNVKNREKELLCKKTPKNLVEPKTSIFNKDKITGVSVRKSNVKNVTTVREYFSSFNPIIDSFSDEIEI